MADAASLAAGVVHAASLALGAAANSLALLAFLRRRRRVALSDRFVVNLLSGGLVTALTLPPLALAELAAVAAGALGGGERGGGGGGVQWGLCAAGEAAAALAASLPPLAVLLLASDQALAVLQPLRYRQRLDTPRAAGLMLVGWALALAFGAACALAPPGEASLWRACRCSAPAGCCSASVLEPSALGPRAAVAGAGFALLFALPFAVTALIYARISGAARRNSQQAAVVGGGAGAAAAAAGAAGCPGRTSIVTTIRSRLSNASALGRRPESRAARVSALVVLLALCCWLPWHALSLARALSAGGGRWADGAVLALLSAASPLAPALFAFRSRRVRRELRRILRLPHAPSPLQGASGGAPLPAAARRPLLARPPSPAAARCPSPGLLLLPSRGSRCAAGDDGLLGAGAPLLPPSGPGDAPPAPTAPRGSFSSAASTQGTTSTDE